MALDQFALLEVLDALRNADAADRITQGAVIGAVSPRPPHAAPTATPDHKFVRDMDDAFDAAMYPGKNPITDIWTYRTFTDDIAKTGHDICRYLGSHNYDETAQHFKLSLPLAYPSDSDSREFVDIAIDDLCPQYSSMKHK